MNRFIFLLLLQMAVCFSGEFALAQSTQTPEVIDRQAPSQDTEAPLQQATTTTDASPAGERQAAGTTSESRTALQRDQLVLSTRESIGLSDLESRIRATNDAAQDFNELRALRNRLSAATERVRSELWEAERRVSLLPPAIQLEQWRDEARDDLRCAQDPDCDELTNRGISAGPVAFPGSGVVDVSFLRGELRRFELDFQLASEGERKIPTARALLSELERLSDELDRKINDALNRDLEEQKFKTQVSLYFTAIVGVMIVLFFALLFWDEKIRNSLFSTPSAIQFVTLFSVVIAIILFGITGILQDKELSALLGGLSGYILGRYSNDSPGSS